MLVVHREQGLVGPERGEHDGGGERVDPPGLEVDGKEHAFVGGDEDQLGLGVEADRLGDRGETTADRVGELGERREPVGPHGSPLAGQTQRHGGAAVPAGNRSVNCLA